MTKGSAARCPDVTVADPPPDRPLTSDRRNEFDWTDGPPTLADLADLIGEVVDELILGETPRLRDLILTLTVATQAVKPVRSVKHRRLSNGDVVELKKYENGASTLILKRPDGSVRWRPRGGRRRQPIDRLDSDLEVVRRLCQGLLIGKPKPEVLEDLRELKKRFEANGRNRGIKRRSSPELSIKQFGKALGMDPYRDFKIKAEKEWGLRAENKARTRWTIDYNLLNDLGKESEIETYIHNRTPRTREK